MRTIHKTISLDEYVSRLPGVATAVSGGTWANFALPEHIRKGFGNYGLIPSDVELPDYIASAVTDYTDIYVNYPSSEEGEYVELSVIDRTLYDGDEEKKILSYQTLMEWYRFMARYINLLESVDCRNFSSAVEYFDIKINGTPSQREEYEEMDRLFKARGGRAFFDWVNEYIIPSFRIPKEFRSEWGTSRLFYPEAMMWYGWMSSHSADTECCEQVEYERIGGDELLESLSGWCVGKIDEISNYSGFTDSASINVPINLTRATKNLGEMDILSEEWIPGIDYKSGNITTMDSESMYLSLSEESGHTTNEFKEIIPVDWSGYTPMYMSEHSDMFVPISSYTYDRHGAVIMNPDDEKMSYVVPFVKKELVVIGDSMYNVVNGYYVEYESENSLADGRHFPVRFSSGGVPYVIINRRRYNGIKRNGTYVFNFNGRGAAATYTPMKKAKFVEYNETIYEMSGNEVYITYDDTTLIYKQIDGYYNDEYGRTYYVYDGKLMTSFEFPYTSETGPYEQTFIEQDNKEWKSVEVDAEHSTLKITQSYDIIECRTISGYTSNKAQNVIDSVLSIDEAGIELPGKYVRNEDEMSPKEGHVLDLYFHVGNVKNVSTIDKGSDLFNGNIITSMKFYYKNFDDVESGSSVSIYMDGEGNIITEPSDESYGGETIWAIEKLKEMNEDDDGIDKEKVYCDMIYHVGAILSGSVDEEKEYLYEPTHRYELRTEKASDEVVEMERKDPPPKTINIISRKYTEQDEAKNYKKIFVAKNGDDYVNYPGVIYKDTLILTEDECFYKMYDGTSYPLNYYAIEYNAYIPWKMNEMDDSLYTEHSYFETPILLYGVTDGEVKPDTDYYDWERFSKYNGIEAYPVFRIESRLGMASPEKVSNNIYIDRGSGAALDKHLRLGEIKTMEALENYSNGMLKIVQEQ